MGAGRRKERKGESPSFHNKASKEGGKKSKKRQLRQDPGKEPILNYQIYPWGSQRLLRKTESDISSLLSIPHKGSEWWKQRDERVTVNSTEKLEVALPQCSHFSYNYSLAITAPAYHRGVSWMNTTVSARVSRVGCEGGTQGPDPKGLGK